MEKRQEVKVVFIGESGCGKSTLIRHLASSPDELIYASSSEGHAGTTKVTVEYLYGKYDKIDIDAVYCNILYARNNDFKFLGDVGFESYLNTIEEMKNLDRSGDNYESIINDYAKQYLKQMSLKKLFETINKPSTFFNRIVITVPVNKDLYTHLEANGIDQLRIVDTRGLGDQDDIERIIPFSGADAIMIIAKNATPTPSIKESLIKVCQDFKHVPVLFVGTHSINEDEVDVTSYDSVEEYLLKLSEFNKTPDCQIRHLYADVFEKHIELIEPVRKVMAECRINNVPYIKSLAVPTAQDSKYYKFYIPACIQFFSNCIKTIRSFQIAQKDVADQLRNNKNNLYNAMNTKEILQNVVNYLTITPRDYEWYVDFLSVAKGQAKRHGSPLDYSYDCVAATLYSMLKTSIEKSVLSFNNTISNDILLFFFKRVLQYNSRDWYWGYNNGYYYQIINFRYSIAQKCKKKLIERDLSLDNVVCTRFGTKYDTYKSIKILLFEECLHYLINIIDDDTELNNYIDADPA